MLTTAPVLSGRGMRKCADQGVQAEKPLDTLGCRVIQQSTFTERYPRETSGYVGRRISVRKAVKSAMWQWDKVLKHKGVYPTPFCTFPLPPAPVSNRLLGLRASTTLHTIVGTKRLALYGRCWLEQFRG